MGELAVIEPTYGVAKGATIVSVQVLDCNGAGTSSSTLGGIEWAVEDALAHPSNPAVISMSIGGNFSAAVNDAVEQAKANGVLVVAAAGNENDDSCNYSPSSSSAALTVGATTSSDDDAVSQR